jgi:sigma-B regulation protein RsbU (phosphoserine phosphatase)
VRKIDPRWWVAICALTFAANFVVDNIYLPFAGTPSIGIQFKFGDDTPRIWKIEQQSPAFLAGLMPGDTIRAVSGSPIDTINQYYLEEQLVRPNRPLEMTIEREGHSLSISIATQGSYFYSLSTLNRIALTFWIFVAALELVLAFALVYSRSTDVSAVFAAMFLAALTTLNAQSSGVAAAFRSLPGILKPVIFPVLVISVCIPFFAFAFCANFPRPLFRSRRIWAVLCVPAVVIYLFTAVLNYPFLFGDHPEDLFRSRLTILYDRFQLLLVLIILAYAVAAVAAIIINYRRCDIVERRRVKLMLVGALIGLASVVPAAIIHDLVYSDLISRSGLISIGFGILRIVFLISLVYAVLKHRVFDIPVLLQRSGRYLLVQRGYLIVLAAGGIAVTALFARLLARDFPVEPGFAVPVGAAFGMALVWIGAIVHRRVQVRLDRAFFRAAYDAQQILEGMAEKSRRATSRSELAEVLRVHVHQALHPVRMAVLLETSPRQLTLFDSSGLPPMTVSASSPVLLAITKSGRAIELEPKEWESSKCCDLRQLQPECLVPIIGRGEELRGVVVLGPKLSEEPYSGEDLRLLQSAATQAGVALENISLAEDIAVRLHTEQLAARELDIARSVQSKFLPDAAPVLTSLDFVGRCLQARQVGGDFYDFLEYAPGMIGVVLADIAGKGISAALLMANLQAHLRSHRVESASDLESTLVSVNRLFKKSIEVGSFATLFLGFYDDTASVLTYANCGHAPPVVMRRDGRVHRLEATATVLGAFADWECEVQSVTIEPGDVLVLYSDGITEAENENGEQFGEARLLELLHGCRNLGADQLLEAIIGSVLDFSHNEQLDDITLVIGQSKVVPNLLRQAASSSHLTQ